MILPVFTCVYLWACVEYVSPGEKPTGCRLIAEHRRLWSCSSRSAGRSRKGEKVDRMRTRESSQPYIFTDNLPGLCSSAVEIQWSQELFSLELLSTNDIVPLERLWIIHSSVSGKNVFLEALTNSISTVLGSKHTWKRWKGRSNRSATGAHGRNSNQGELENYDWK